MSTKTLRRCALSLAAVLFLAAAPPPVKTQSPGFFRLAVGNFEVTALYDGNLRISPAGLHGLDGPAVNAQLAAEFADVDKNGVRTDINAYLVNTGEHLILVDGGNEGCAFGEVGRLSGNLRAAGYRPEDVDTVLITHLHGDHVCGLTAGDKRLYPNAIIFVAEKEAAFWQSPPAGPDDRYARLKQMAQQSLAPYQAANALRTFKPDAELFAGVTAMDTSGHTPGHVAYLFESGGQGFLASGDIVHVGAVQFAHPEVWISSDVDQKAAVATRTALFKTMADKGWSVSGAHLPFPGIGHLRRDGKAWRFVPVEYAPLP